jgi:hypothetical protein
MLLHFCSFPAIAVRTSGTRGCQTTPQAIGESDYAKAQDEVPQTRHDGQTDVVGTVLYVCVSTDEQANKASNLKNQERTCREFCHREGWPVIKMSIDPLALWTDRTSSACLPIAVKSACGSIRRDFDKVSSSGKSGVLIEKPHSVFARLPSPYHCYYLRETSRIAEGCISEDELGRVPRQRTRLRRPRPR